MSRTLVFLVVAVACAAQAPNAPSDPNGPLTPDEEALTAQQLLGKRIFEDASLSEPAGVACVSCHDPAKAYTGNNGSMIAAIARGAAASAHETRNTPTLAYA